MAIRIENSLFLMVNGRSNFCPPLKAFGGKGETGKTPKSGKEFGRNRQEKRQENPQESRHVICMNKGE